MSIKETKYKSKLVFVLDVYENELPIFEVIKDLILYNNTLVIFKCICINTVIFDDHVFSNEVK